MRLSINSFAIVEHGEGRGLLWIKLQRRKRSRRGKFFTLTIPMDPNVQVAWAGTDFGTVIGRAFYPQKDPYDLAGEDTPIPLPRSFVFAMWLKARQQGVLRKYGLV